MTQEIITFHSEADVGVSWKVVDSVKGELTKSDLRSINRTGVVMNSCFFAKNWRLSCNRVLTRSSVGRAQSAN